MNLFYETFDNRISKFKVYNVHTMGEEFMVVSGMPNRIGENGLAAGQVLISPSSVSCVGPALHWTGQGREGQGRVL